MREALNLLASFLLAVYGSAMAFLFVWVLIIGPVTIQDGLGWPLVFEIAFSLGMTTLGIWLTVHNVRDMSRED